MENLLCELSKLFRFFNCNFEELASFLKVHREDLEAEFRDSEDLFNFTFNFTDVRPPQ